MFRGSVVTYFFFSSRRRHTRLTCDWSSDVCSSDLTEHAIGVALDIRGLTLPVVPAPFHNPVDEIGLRTRVMGPIPAGSPRLAAAAWRDAGGTVELDHFAARWGTLAISGSGTLA